MEQFLHGIDVVEIDDGIRPIRTARSSVIGLIGTAPDADATAFPLDVPVLLPGTPREAAKLGAAGTLKDAIDGIFDHIGAVVVVVRVAEGATPADTLANLVGDATAMTGVHAFLTAETVVKVSPRILIAPGYTSDRPGGAANPVVAEMLGIADRLRAMIFADGPNTTDAEAIAWRQDFDSARLAVVDPYSLVFDTAVGGPVAKPSSARLAGIQAQLDNDRGFWWSPSNKAINGVVGAARAVGFDLSDSNAAANLLNENEVITIVHRDGYRFWGNRTLSSDPLWAFIPVRRTADIIYDSIEDAFLWALDRPFSANLILDIQESVNAFLRRLKTQGAILGGRAWVDPELNTKDVLLAGRLYVDFDIEPAGPLERLTFRAHRNAGYYDELVDEVTRAA